ncbi:MAG: PAS domain S-box protein [Gemmatimonadetes bacterium]|nr:PAS domain S-box protein [Gemmatimonadota bacterium]
MHGAEEAVRVRRDSGERPAVLLRSAALRSLVEGASDAIFVIDASGMLLMANPATHALVGAAPEELVGRTALVYVDTPDQVRVEEEVRRVLAGEPRRFECSALRTDGSRRLLSVAVSPAHDVGVVTGALCVARDVTDERAQAEALERAEARYTRLFEIAEDAIATMDESGVLTTVNRALEEVTGRTRQQMIGRHFIDFLDPSERTGMWQAFAAALSGQRPYRELRFTRRDGRGGIATVRAAPIVEHNRVVGVLAVVRDVTDEHRLVQEVVRREKLAALGEVVGGVAHEINTPLTGILAFAQILLARGLPDDGARQAATTIVAEAKRAARIVDSLLTFARQTPTERSRTDVNLLLAQTADLRRIALREGGVILEVDLDPALPVTWADAGQLQQVFLNLIANAEQALAGVEGTRRITVSSRREGESIVVGVRDSGPGIAPEHLPHIFNPFYTTKPRGIGTGLGLSISDGIVRGHDGTVRVQSDMGAGALFEVILPVVSPPVTVPV